MHLDSDSEVGLFYWLDGNGHLDMSYNFTEKKMMNHWTKSQSDFKSNYNAA